MQNILHMDPHPTEGQQKHHILTSDNGSCAWTDPLRHTAGWFSVRLGELTCHPNGRSAWMDPL